MNVAYTKAVAISVDPPYQCMELRSALDAHIPYLSDQRRVWQKELEIVEYTDADHNPHIPTTFMLEPRLIIYKVYNGYWFWGRPTVEDIRQDFRAMTMKCRADWDLAAPGVREAWEEATKEGRRLRGIDFSRAIQAKRNELGVS